jgi:beta-lactamase superfamily II metal-dependent hydrolase
MNNKRWKYIFFILLLAAGFILLALLKTPDKNLHVIACDVGQGDAILIMYKNNEVLIDGGPGSSVVNCLSRHLPFWDRTIEMVMMTGWIPAMKVIEC